MIKDKNIRKANPGDIIKIGRMKGNIFVGNKIFKISDKALTFSALETLNKENIKRNLNCKLIVHKDLPIELTVFDENGIEVSIHSDVIPEIATNLPITKERLITQLSKTNNTPYQFSNIEIDLDDGLFIKGFSCINELRRTVLSKYEELLIASFRRDLVSHFNLPISSNINNEPIESYKKVSLLLNLLNKNYEYAELKNVDNIYIPFKYFILTGYTSILQYFTNKFNTYIYFPTIIRNNYNRLISKNLPDILNSYNIKGFVVSNIGNFELLKNYKKYELFAIIPLMFLIDSQLIN